MTKIDFGKRLAELRKELGVSQKRLAAIAQLSSSHVNRIEKGSRPPPSAVKVLAIVAALRLQRAAAQELVELAGYSSSILESAGSLSYPSPSLDHAQSSSERVAALVDRLPPIQREKVLLAIAALIDSLMLEVEGLRLAGKPGDRSPNDT